MDPHKSTPLTSTTARALGVSQPAVYQIVLGACLDDHWRGWFTGMALASDLDDKTTTLTGRVADQAALHGLLAQIRDLGLPLLSVTFIPGDAN